MIQRYMSKVSRSLLDRIDLHVDVLAVRFRGRKGFSANADMQTKEIREFCRLDAAVRNR